MFDRTEEKRSDKKGQVTFWGLEPIPVLRCLLWTVFCYNTFKKTSFLVAEMCDQWIRVINEKQKITVSRWRINSRTNRLGWLKPIRSCDKRMLSLKLNSRRKEFQTCCRSETHLRNRETIKNVWPKLKSFTAYNCQNMKVDLIAQQH